MRFKSQVPYSKSQTVCRTGRTHVLAVDEGDGHLELVQARLQGGVRPRAGSQQVTQRVLRVCRCIGMTTGAASEHTRRI